MAGAMGTKKKRQEKISHKPMSMGRDMPSLKLNREKPGGDVRLGRGVNLTARKIGHNFQNERKGPRVLIKSRGERASWGEGKGNGQVSLEKNWGKGPIKIGRI